VLFEEASKAFYILRVALDDGGKILSVKGHIPGLQIKVGTWFGFEAESTIHKTYGQQWLITKAPIIQTSWDAPSIVRALVSQGVGERVVLAIREHFGDVGLLEALHDPKQLEQVPGVDSFVALYVHQRWVATQAYFKGLSFLMDLKLPAGLVKQVWATFGENVAEVLGKNPWALTKVEGISFQQADEIAQRLGIPVTSPDRLKGLLAYTVKSRRTLGHMYMTTAQLAGALPEVAPAEVGPALAACHKENSIVIDREAKTGTFAIYDPWAYELETKATKLLLERQEKARFDPKGTNTKEYIQRLAFFGPRTEKEAKKRKTTLDKVITTAVEEWGDTNQFVLSAEQKKGVMNALQAPVSILTGLPGAGKTSSLVAAVNILQDAGVKFLLCAPTGIAAKNLGARTGAPASTLHRAFAAQGKSDDSRDTSYLGVLGGENESLSLSEKDEKWGYGPESPYPAEVVIMDEASMTDAHLLYRLLTCTSPTTRLVIVGDAAQLPSVGPGNVLRDLIQSDLFPVVSLKEIFRQKDTSAIVYAAHNIVKGEIPECDLKSDFKLIPTASEEQALEVILSLAAGLYKKRANFQVLSPRHAGLVGVTNLNTKLRDLLNPTRLGIQEFSLGPDSLVREDDRIMVVRNDYELGIYNGDVGKVSRVDQKAKEIEIKIFGDPVIQVCIPFKLAPSTIRLAYSCTIHKCVTGDTLISTERGLIPIQKLAKVIPEGHRFAPAVLSVVTQTGWAKTDQIFSGGVEPTIKVTTRLGYSLEGSHRHPVLVVSDVGEVWKKLPEIQPGDTLVLRRGCSRTVSYLSTSGFSPSANTPGHSQRLGQIPPVLDERLGWLLGVLVGDGNQTDQRDGRVECAQTDLVFCKRVADIARTLFAVNPTIRSRSVYFHGKRVREFLAWIGLGYAKGPEKQIPWAILESPTSVQCAFLQGLFDTDGGVSKVIHYTTTSPRLAFEVQQLLLANGIISSRECMREAKPERNWSAAYRVNVMGDADKRRFLTSIGFSLQRKQDALHKSLQARESHSKSNVGAIPGGLGLARQLRESLHLRGGRNYPESGAVGGLLSRVITGVSILRIAHLDKIYTSIPQLEALGAAGKFLAGLREGDLFLDPVVKVEEGSAPVFDLHVPEGHTYIGNGFVNHNSQGLEYDIIIMPLVDSFRHQLQRNLLYTAVTRARQKVFLVGTSTALASAVENAREDLRNTLLADRLKKAGEKAPSEE